MNTIFRRGLFGLAAVAALSATPAFAEMQTYKGTLNGASQVPPVTTKGAGAVTATYDTATKKLTWTATYADLSGPPTAAHFHGPAAAGANAAVVVPQKDGLASPMKGEATLTDAQAADFTAGRWYFNIHTTPTRAARFAAKSLSRQAPPNLLPVTHRRQATQA